MYRQTPENSCLHDTAQPKKKKCMVPQAARPPFVLRGRVSILADDLVGRLFAVLGSCFGKLRNARRGLNVGDAVNLVDMAVANNTTFDGEVVNARFHGLSNINEGIGMLKVRVLGDFNGLLSSLDLSGFKSGLLERCWFFVRGGFFNGFISEIMRNESPCISDKLGFLNVTNRSCLVLLFRFELGIFNSFTFLNMFLDVLLGNIVLSFRFSLQRRVFNRRILNVFFRFRLSPSLRLSLGLGSLFSFELSLSRWFFFWLLL